MSQSEEPPEIDQPDDDEDKNEFKIITSIKKYCFDKDDNQPATPMTFKKRRSFELQIPKLSKLDRDTSKRLISAYNCLFRVQTNPETSLSQDWFDFNVLNFLEALFWLFCDNVNS